MNDIEIIYGTPVKHYINASGVYLAGWNENPPVDAIEIDGPPPINADQPWLFPGWGPSPFKMKQDEMEWQSAEMAAIANQIIAIEDGATDALPGTRKQWGDYRTLVRLWHESPNFPDSTRRPVRPA